MRLRLVGALCAGDQDKISNLIKNDEAVVNSLQLLHIAVRISPVNTINWILRNYDFDINATDGDGNTPLHLAALYGRQDVALALLSIPQINDAIENRDGKQPVEVCKYPETAEVMQVARAQYVERTAGQLRKYLLEEDVKALEDLLSHPRAAALLDINGQDPDSGSTVLHEFCKKRNKKMVEFILAHGGDPFRRDCKGVLPIDVTKDEGIRRLLRTARKEQNVIQARASNRTPQMGNPPTMKGYLKKWTNITGGYKLRWFVLENGVLSYYKKQDDTEKACRGSIIMKQAQLHLDSSEKLRFEVLVKGTNSKFHLKANHPVETNRWVWALTHAIQYAKDLDSQSTSSTNSLVPLSSQTASSGASIRSSVRRSAQKKSTDSLSQKIARSISQSTAGTRSSSSGFDKDDELDPDESEADLGDGSDFSDVEPSRSVASLEDIVKVEIRSIRELLGGLQKRASTLTTELLREGFEALQSSLGSLEGAVNDYSGHVTTRIDYFEKVLEKAHIKEQLWFKTVQDLETDHERIQGDLYRALQKKREASKLLRAVGTGKPQGTTAADTTVTTIDSTKFSRLEDEEDLSEEEDEEFFDALAECGAAPAVEIVNESTTEEKMTDKQLEKKSALVEDNSFAGYPDKPRTKLTMDEDHRPKISLWGILKSMIGKDMTRMTLPVSFNECTNLLQRSAEDMEYTDILDNAARIIDDPSLRLAHVVAFAASSYSSTINRIAKPFNPILGETFEYCRPDCGYRMFSEQVSHHPPIGALLAESVKWDFYGDSNVESRFNGRTFDFKPLGRWYVVIRPDNGAGIEEELYSFRKLTSSVVGIITGSPAVDNYGDMEVVNHTLGHKALVKFKSRGWRGTHAYELKGLVKSPNGVAEWIVGGKWNDKIYARKLEANSEESDGQKSPEVEVESSFSHHENKPVLLWQIHDRPKAPFNLTPFAISLNALPDSLREWIAPTDTRLRPDQRAMEEFRYDDAAVEKRRVEEKQRAARREREEKNITYRPKWFTKEKHPVTGEDYYRPSLEYWRLRKDKKLADAGDIF